MKHPTLLSRLHAAASLVFKSGAPFPFNKIMPYDATGGERMYRAFEQSTWVMRAIKKIAGPIAAVDLHFARNGERYHDAGLEGFWEMPGAGLTRTDLIEATVGWMKLEGEAFWIMDDSWMAPFPGSVGASARCRASGEGIGTMGRTPLPNPLPTAWGEGTGIAGADASARRPYRAGAAAAAPYQYRNPLIVARPDRMRHIVRNGELVGWEYSDAAGKRSLLLPEQVVQLKMWNPYNDWRGMAELKPCRDAAEADFLAGKFNLNVMRSNGDQGVYIIAKEGLPLDGQRQQIVDQIREKRELAQRGVFKPAFLDGNITIEDPKIRVPDADFIAARLQNRHEVFIAMGVPASMADVKASYSIGSASDWFMLIAETCIPLGEKICEGINQVLRRQGASEARASLNWDEHPVIQAVRRERADTAQKYFAMGVPLKALNDYLDLELPECPGWEKGYLALNLAEVAGEEKEADLPETMDDTVALMRRELGAAARLKRTVELRIADCGLRIGEKTDDAVAGVADGAAGETGNGNCELQIENCKLAIAEGRAGGSRLQPADAARWHALMAQRRPMVRAFVSRFTRELMKARGETLRRLEGKGECVFDSEGFAKGLAAGLRPVMAAALLQAGKELFAEAGCELTFAMPKEVSAEFLGRHEEVWRTEAATIGSEITGAISAAAVRMDGSSAGPVARRDGRVARVTQELEQTAADAVRAKFNEIAKRRAQELAVNGIGAAFGLARDVAMRLAGVAEKRWLCSENASESHRAANGQIVKVEEAFAVGGEQVRYPGAEGMKVRNCRCVAVCAGRRDGNDGKSVADCIDGMNGMHKVEGPEGTGRTRGLAAQEAGTPPIRRVKSEKLWFDPQAAVRRLIHPEVRVVDAQLGIVDYVASDESVDSYQEVIRAAGWRFTHFSKNAPFVDSHDYSSIGKCLGRVVDFRVEGDRLIERVQWAIDVPENQLARIGWKMTEAGYLKAVSVGFFPVKYVTPGSGAEWGRQLKELGLPADAAVRMIYTEQEQVELSCCVVGSNPNALAKAYRAGAIDDADIETLSMEYSQRENGRAADCPAPAAPAREQARRRFLEEWRKAMQVK